MLYAAGELFIGFKLMGRRSQPQLIPLRRGFSLTESKDTSISK